MEAIALCESGGKQFNSVGVVIESKTHDYGIMQINRTWLPVARKMGLDIIHSEKDNVEFGYWLYEHFGTQPWNSSKHCWKDMDTS